MNKNGNRKHGPHGPGCECDDNNLSVGLAIAEVLTEILIPLLDRWENGDSGATVDFRFDHGKKVDAIAVRVGPLAGDREWPISDDPDAVAAILENEKEHVH